MIFKRKLEQLDREIESLQAAGDRSGEAAVRGKKMVFYLLSGKVKAALAESAKITALTTGTAGQYEELVEQLYTQGLEMARHPGQQRGAIDLLNKAAATYHVLGDKLGEANALKAEATLELQLDELNDALRHVNKAIALFDSSDNNETDLALLAALYQLRAECYARRGNEETAWADTDRALVLAQQSNDTWLIQKIQAERNSLAQRMAKNKPADDQTFTQK